MPASGSLVPRARTALRSGGAFLTTAASRRIWRPAHITLANGRQLFVDRTDRRGRKLLRRADGLYPRATRMWQLLAGATNWDLIIDVGANYGEMILSIPKPTSATAIAIEPNTRVAAYLARSLEAARMPVVLCACAVADSGGYQYLDVDPGSSGGSSLVAASGTVVKDLVRVEKLDDLIFGGVGLQSVEGARVLLKIDVEGAEPRVLAGATRLLTESLEIAVMIEMFRTSVAEVKQASGGLDVAQLYAHSDRFVDSDELPSARLDEIWSLDSVLYRCEPGSKLEVLLRAGSPSLNATHTKGDGR